MSGHARRHPDGLATACRFAALRNHAAAAAGRHPRAGEAFARRVRLQPGGTAAKKVANRDIRV